MIDYEKLKLAHTLIKNMQLGYFRLETRFKKSNLTTFAIAFYDNNDLFHHYCVGNIDELITRLEKLIDESKPKSKYGVGDTVFHCASFKTNSPIIFSLIESIDYISDSFVYILNNSPALNEDWLYPSRESLIESQIKHWQSLLEETQKIL